MSKSATIAFFLIFFSTSALANIPTIKKIDCKTIDNIKQCKYQTGSTISYVITPMPYALCAQAKCTMDTSNAKIAMCQCPIYGINSNNWQSISISDKTYDDVKPAFDGKDLKQVTSNFSLAMSSSNTNVDVTHTVCKSSSPKPWANCFGVRCDVVITVESGMKKLKANCQCPVQNSTTYFSSGPKNTNDCNLGPNEIWSAATGEAGMGQYELIMTLYKNYQSSSK